MTEHTERNRPTGPDELTTPYTIISSDTHAGLPTELYRDYLATKHHGAFDQFMSEREAQLKAITDLGVRNEDFAANWFETNEEVLRSGWEVDRRDLELDKDGVVGEVIFPDADAVESRTCVPFGAGLGLSGDMDPELGLAGAQAHNRWLAELCKTSPERRRGVALIPITAAIEDVLAEIRRIKADGLGAVMIPAMWMNQTPYHDRKYDPVWALCEDLELPVVTHSGPADREAYGNHLGIYVTEVTWWPSRPLWFLLWSGVFERFPRLRFGVTEAGCWWVGNLLWFTDRLLLGSRGAAKLAGFEEIKLLPSEYFDRNCFIGASNTKRREIGMRYEIGVGNICWGNDFPHPEGTWPETLNILRKTFSDVPIAETRVMLGEAVADVYGFDLAALKPHAERVGVTPATLGQVNEDGSAKDLTTKWAAAAEIGRHWLTGHDTGAAINPNAEALEV
ncbi:amidohydrolase family protein [Embleya sp. NPDC008237]|uniref:amidohydrolase family protein n=1 Tax=Embleya sp. NPDC008237 TaxID=3363978 RepID=UPI0036E5C43E